MAYTTPEEVEDYLGKTFTAAQLLEAAALIPAADAWVDAYTGRTWNTSTTITGELHESPGPYLTLRQRPVTSITTVTARETAIGATPKTLTAGVDYELLDASRGLLNLGGWWRDRLISVTYVPALPLDARVHLASTKIVAAWMGASLGEVDTSQVAEVQYGQELRVKYRESASTGGSEVPDDVLTLLGPLRKVVFA